MQQCPLVVQHLECVVGTQRPCSFGPNLPLLPLRETFNVLKLRMEASLVDEIGVLFPRRLLLLVVASSSLLSGVGLDSTLLS